MVGVHLIRCALRQFGRLTRLSRRSLENLRGKLKKFLPTGFFGCATFGRLTRPSRRSFGRGVNAGPCGVGRILYLELFYQLVGVCNKFNFLFFFSAEKEAELEKTISPSLKVEMAGLKQDVSYDQKGTEVDGGNVGGEELDKRSPNETATAEI